MLKIQNNKVKITFNKLLYSKDNLLLAKRIYKNLCIVDIKENNSYFIIHLQPLDKNINSKTLALEFSNYILSLHKI